MKIHAGIKKKSNDICFKVYSLYSKKLKLLHLLILIKKSIYLIGKDYIVSYFTCFEIKRACKYPTSKLMTI